jgi:chitinase
LRTDPVGSKLVLTAAVGLAPFVGSDGTPMTDVSQFASVLDHIGARATTYASPMFNAYTPLLTSIAIMNYDVWGSWSTGVGPNAPLDDSCAPVKAGSATSALQAWTSAGFPASKAIHVFSAQNKSDFECFFR